MYQPIYLPISKLGQLDLLEAGYVSTIQSKII